MRQVVQCALSSISKLLLKLQVMLTARGEALPLLGSSNTTAWLVNRALEGDKLQLTQAYHFHFNNCQWAGG